MRTSQRALTTAIVVTAIAGSYAGATAATRPAKAASATFGTPVVVDHFALPGHERGQFCQCFTDFLTRNENCRAGSEATGRLSDAAASIEVVEVVGRHREQAEGIAGCGQLGRRHGYSCDLDRGPSCSGPCLFAGH